MGDYPEREAAVGKELKASAERGAGKRCPDPRSSPSLATLRPIVKKGVSLAEMFDRIAAGTEEGLWGPSVSVCGPDRYRSTDSPSRLVRGLTSTGASWGYSMTSSNSPVLASAWGGLKENWLARNLKT